MKTTFLRKQINACSALLLMAVTVFGCGGDYDDTALKNDLNDLKSRVEKLESWCSTANTQISALQGLVEAMEQNDCITGITPGHVALRGRDSAETETGRCPAIKDNTGQGGYRRRTGRPEALPH